MTDAYDWEQDAKDSYLVGIAAKREELLLDTITGLKRVKVFPGGGCELYQGDCLEIMPQLDKVDAVVTDPPYGIENLVGEYGRSGRNISGDTNLDAMRDGVSGAWNLTRENAWAFIFYSSRITPQVIPALPCADYFGEIIWDKKAPGMGKSIRYQHENIAVLRKGTANFLRDIFSVIKSFRVGDVHPHQKPVELLEMIIASVQSTTILDPFAGSGTTLVACAKMGRKGIGIELDPDYFDIACKRVEEAYRQPDLFVAPVEQPEQVTFDLDQENPE